MARSAFKQTATETEQARLHRLAQRYGIKLEDFTHPDSVRGSMHVPLPHEEMRKLEKIAERHGTTRTQIVRGMIRSRLKEFDDSIVSVDG